MHALGTRLLLLLLLCLPAAALAAPVADLEAEVDALPALALIPRKGNP